MGRIWLAGLALSLLLAFGVFWLASNTTRYAFDTSIDVIELTSPKSLPQYYAPGFAPPLEYSENRVPCDNNISTKRALFGDLHVHTAFSGDAYAEGTRLYPQDAYRFAQGETVLFPGPGDTDGAPIQIGRPLDFVAVTDHSEAFGESYICRNEGAYPGYNSRACQIYREGKEPGVRVFGVPRAGTRPERVASVCGEDGADCREAARIVWQQVIDAAEDAYDRTPGCSFTSLVGYEYTRSPSGMHMHRNTIFKNAEVPGFPANYIDYPTLPSLLGKLETECRLGIEACDVLSIPHNSNISSGNAFNLRSLEGLSEEAQQRHLRQRQAYDRLIEITQHKGASECVNGITDILGDEDEYCDVEAIRQIGSEERAFDTTQWIPRLFRLTIEECTDANFDVVDNLYKGPCVASRDFARGAWLDGLQAHSHTGVNPFQMGVIAATDNHVALPGHTSEAGWRGHIVHESTLEGRMGEARLGRHNRLESNPGGLAGVWAVENSRDAIFQSLKRRETFGTSGTRIEPRFFAGDYSSDLCSAPDWLEQAYANGVPMGADIPAPQEGISFLLQALADRGPSIMPLPLQELQLIKGWIDGDGNKRFDVKSIVTAPPQGSETLCAVYRDEEYDPALPAYYYLRVIEKPMPRWSAAQCSAEEETQWPEACAGEVGRTINEMAWTSPIWLTPQ
ncbi:MAG: DUF3604 domain-containing protein [Pseudomonadota bacterium]